MSTDAKKRRQQTINQLNPSQQSWQEWRVRPTRNRFLYKCIISLCIYALIGTLFQLDHSYAVRIQQAVKGAMNHSFDYEELTSWYQTNIGELPTLLPTYLEHVDRRTPTEYALPVSGYTNRLDSGQAGVLRIPTAVDRKVTSIGRGLVQYVTPTRANGWTVNVLYADGIQAIYGGLDEVQLEKNDWLEEGALIGHTDMLYFAIKKGEQFVNPGDVIPFD